MRNRSIIKFSPGLERFEAKQLLSAGSSTTHLATPNDHRAGIDGRSSWFQRRDHGG